MSCEETSVALSLLVKSRKIRVIVEGPASCGKTTVIKKVLTDSLVEFERITPLSLYGKPAVSPEYVFNRCIREGKLIFLDGVDSIFHAKDTNFSILHNLLSQKPNIICACRNSQDVHPILLRYLRDRLKMSVPRRNDYKNIAGDVTLDSIGGLHEIKSLLLMLAGWSPESIAKVRSWGLQPPSGAILYGPPGTGKTLLARAVSNVCGRRFFSISIPDLLRCEVGESEKQLTTIIDQSISDSPSLVFIDEIQALFGERNEMRQDSNRLIIHLVRQIDRSLADGSVFFLAATNAIEAIDKSLLQPGRFEEIIHVSLPTPEDRIEIFNVCLRSIKHSDDVKSNAADLAKSMHGFSSSDISGLLQRACVRAILRGDSVICAEDVRAEISAEILNRGR